jgi:glycogen debranching enzyme
MKILSFLTVLISMGLLGCTSEEESDSRPLYKQTLTLPSIVGKPQYLNSPFVAAGDRVYLIGHQDGSFPDLGWHVPGEMGGIWDHPIKLMDGFAATITSTNNFNPYCLDKADIFTNYPIGNLHNYTWNEENIEINRFQFVPDGVEGIIVEFRMINHSADEKELTFAFTGLTDLRPTWLGERTNMIDSQDEISFDSIASLVIAKDQNNPWYTAFGSTLPVIYTEVTNACVPQSRKGLGTIGTLTFNFTLASKAEKIIPIYIAGSYLSESAVRQTYKALKKENLPQLVSKIERFKKIDQSAQLTIADMELQQMYTWLKYNTDWLVRTVPEQGSAISAGLPDYPWWFGTDATYALQGVLATGNHELARNTILLLQKISKATNGNGRVVHEVSTNGAVFNPGNVNETAQFITLLNIYMNWTGDTKLIEELFPEIKNGIVWLTEEMDPDKNGYPNGNGMMEIHGLDTEMVDVVVYTQQALAAAVEMAQVIGETKLANDYQQLADQLKVKINNEWWNEQDKSYGDFRGTVTEALPILNAALIRADTLGKPLAVAELTATRKQLKKYNPAQQIPHVIYHNWVVNTPMETGVADLEKGKLALQTARKYENPFGVYVTGIDRTDEPDSVVLKSRKKTFSYTGAVMTLPTGVQAVGSARYGTPEETLGYLHKLQRSFSYALPGSMYEVSPDFGMVTQAWNIYGVAVPIIQHFFGIQPRAYKKSISIAPRMPTSWNEAAIENVKVGDNAISLTVNQREDHIEYRIQQKEEDWLVIINVKNSKSIQVNGEAIDNTKIIDGLLTLTGQQNIVQVY